MSQKTDTQDRWDLAEKFVLEKLSSLTDAVIKLESIVLKQTIAITRLEEKSKNSSRVSGAVWGFLSGMAVAVVAAIIEKK